ncbi:MFS transporter [Amycolatopsis acidiphila]|uniref:Lysosomal dipeptide transporter MFSD1 n=1 Tax=Amycolatopsis acidiphila TaxID=715473 RepID=A0A557ZY53_9PSEU|nr:MFS transporter [Amycolatopsis acidiphila]TVT16945.1 MFS transporter [Amycolatopsis acidiphila]UIJ63818.1 MFS transporter [Amycolatopsis acidiphila]
MIGKAGRRSWLIWFTAALVYLLSVFHRTSFGVAGLEAADRFGVGAAALGTFTVLQVGVYAAMQIPTGVLVDRYGPRKVLIAALLFLGLGQVLLALATSYGLGLLARGVLGFGDAMTFVSVLRLIAAHFPGRQYAVVTSFTTAIGYVGNLAATVPLTLLLAGPGWLPTFLTAGLLTAVYSAFVAARVKDTPNGRVAKAAPVDRRELLRQIRTAWRVPGTRLGFWVHFSTMFAPNVLTLLWGVPFLVQGQGMPTASASALLTVFVFGSMIGGPLVGGVIGARPGLRMPLVGGYLGGAALVWALLLGWPGSIPVAVLVPCFAFLSLGGPASMIGFALARDYNPLHRVGTATGVVNVGGFVATTITALAIGVLLQLGGGNFRIALLAVVVVLALGTVRVLVWWRRARAELFAAQARGEQVPVQVRRRLWDASADGRVPAAA